MKKEMTLKTKRLLLRPMPIGELEEKIQSMEDNELRQAYQEMLDGCRSAPHDWLWYTPWKIILKSEEKMIGDICFKGPQKRGSVEWGYGLEQPYQGMGYMTEAARMLLDWAFSQPNVYAVEAETLPDNVASQRVLEKLDFKPTGTEGEEGPRFRREKQAAQMSVVYMMLGMCCGISVGTALGKMSIGMVLGMAVGFLLGSVVDSSEKKHRQQITSGEKET